MKASPSNFVQPFKLPFATRTAMRLAAVRSSYDLVNANAVGPNMSPEQSRVTAVTLRNELSAAMTATMGRLQGGTRAAPHFRGVPCGVIAYQSRTGEHPRSRCQS
jgi:hypothetical protein